MPPAAPGIDDVRAAAARIAGIVHRTPVLTSGTLDRELGARVWFKCESLQKTGSYKARGALNAVLRLPDAARGVLTHSSGNHGAALAWAAAVRGVGCTVVIPRDANPVKTAAVAGYGAVIEVCEPGERELAAAVVQARSGAAFIHPYDDPTIIAGQATAALEFLEEVPELDVLVAPIGGGGLLSGAGLVAAALRPGAAVVGAEPEAADDAARSLASGIRQPAVPSPLTIADGLLGGIGEIPFAMLSALDASVVTVSDAEILAAARFHLERMKLVVEPSAAAALAALRKLHVTGRRVGVIISGGNTDLSWW